MWRELFYAPSADNSLLHKPSQLPLGQDGVLEVESAVLIEEGLA